MNICRRFMLLICGGLLASAALSGCGGSSTDNETIPSTVSLFSSHSVIFRNNSTMTMGYNAFGQLGDGTLTSRSTPVHVQGLRGMTKAVAGAEHTLAFGNATTVMAWGYNLYGQVGNASVPNSGGDAFSFKPEKVSFDGTTVTDIAAGGFHSLAVAGGNIWGWGYNGYGQVGNGTVATQQLIPVKLDKDAGDIALAPAEKVAAGGLHSMALIKDGGVNSVYAWGDNSFGQLGFRVYSAARSLKPKKVTFPSDPIATGEFEDIGAGGRFSLALQVARDPISNRVTSQTLWGWGYNFKGELGTSANDTVQLPVKIFTTSTTESDPVVIKKFSAGLTHILLLFGRASTMQLSDGNWTVEAIGYNYYGQLGDNTTTSSFELVQTYKPDGTAGLSGVTDIAAFGNHSLALVNGAWYGWGNNSMGQLGSPVPTSSAGNPKIPVPVQGL